MFRQWLATDSTQWHYLTGGWFNIKMTSYQYRKSHCGDKTILRPSYLHNEISYTGKMPSLYWIRALVPRYPHMSLLRINVIISKYKHFLSRNCSCKSNLLCVAMFVEASSICWWGRFPRMMTAAVYSAPTINLILKARCDVAIAAVQKNRCDAFLIHGSLLSLWLKMVWCLIGAVSFVARVWC